MSSPQTMYVASKGPDFTFEESEFEYAFDDNSLATIPEHNSIYAGINLTFVGKNSKQQHEPCVKIKSKALDDRISRVEKVHENEVFQHMSKVLIGGIEKDLSKTVPTIKIEEVVNASSLPITTRKALHHYNDTKDAIRHVKIHNNIKQTYPDIIVKIPPEDEPRPPFLVSPRAPESCPPSASRRAPHPVGLNKIYMPRVKAEVSKEETIIAEDKQHNDKKQHLEEQMKTLEISKDYKL